MGQCGIFFSIKGQTNKNPIVQAPWQFKRNSLLEQQYYFASLDDKQTVQMFVDALAHFRHEDAKSLISKNFANDFDLKELSDFFHNIVQYKQLLHVKFKNEPKNCVTNSILVIDRSCHNGSIIHLHLIREPDIASNWKVYGIDKE